MLGSLNFIGNPIGLFNNVSSGMKDMIERPIEGFTKGNANYYILIFFRANRRRPWDDYWYFILGSTYSIRNI
jgi:hypothetical protein